MTQERPPWFKCYPEKLLGALIGMSHDAIILYLIILLRIYEVGGPISDTPKALAHRCRMSERRVGAAFGELSDLRKVTIDENNKVDSDTTHEFLDEREGILLSHKNRGLLGAKKRWGKGEQKQYPADSSAMLEACLKHTDKITIEREKKYRKKTPMPNGTALDILRACLSEETANAVLEHRKAKRTPTTTRAAELLAKAFTESGAPEAAANEMIVRGWASFRPTFDWKPKGLNGRSHPNGAAGGIWVSQDDPRWGEFAARWREAHGGKSPPLDKRGGWMFGLEGQP